MTEARFNKYRLPDVGSAWRNYVSTPNESTYRPEQLEQIAIVLATSPNEVHQYGAGMAYAEAAQKSQDIGQSYDYLVGAESSLSIAHQIAERDGDVTKLTRYSLALASLPLYDTPRLIEDFEHHTDNLHYVRQKLIVAHSELINTIKTTGDPERSGHAIALLHELVILVALLESPNMDNAGFVPYHSFPWQNARKFLHTQPRKSTNFDIGIYSLAQRKTKYKIDITSVKKVWATSDDIIYVSIEDILREVAKYRPELYGPGNQPSFSADSDLDPDVTAFASQYVTGRFKKSLKKR